MFLGVFSCHHIEVCVGVFFCCAVIQVETVCGYSGSLPRSPFVSRWPLLTGDIHWHWRPAELLRSLRRPRMSAFLLHRLLLFLSAADLVKAACVSVINNKIFSISEFLFHLKTTTDTYQGFFVLTKEVLAFYKTQNHQDCDRNILPISYF